MNMAPKDALRMNHRAQSSAFRNSIFEAAVNGMNLRLVRSHQGYKLYWMGPAARAAGKKSQESSGIIESERCHQGP